MLKVNRVKNPHTLILATKYGRLGNRLFVFAHIVAFAIENKLTVLNPAFDEYGQYFESTKNSIVCRFPVRKLIVRGNKRLRRNFYKFVDLIYRINIRLRLIPTIRINWEKEKFDFNDSAVRNQVDTIKDKPLVFLSGLYFLDHVNFRLHADEIRSYFKLCDPYDSNVKQLITEARKKCDLLIGVHIRHGDYKHAFGGLYYYETTEYLERMKQIKKLFKDKKVNFLICSDTMQDESSFRGLECRFGTGNVVEDLYSLAKCDYLLGPPSSFTRWASFYGKVPLYVLNSRERGDNKKNQSEKEITLHEFNVSKSGETEKKFSNK